MTNKANWSVVRLGPSEGSKSDWPLGQRPLRDELAPKSRQSGSAGRDAGHDARRASGDTKKPAASSDRSVGIRVARTTLKPSVRQGFGPTLLRRVRP